MGGQALVDRYGVAASVAIHAAHREGDQRNHNAHILTTTCVLSADGLTDKTRVLGAASTGGPELKLGPVANAIERREQFAVEAEGRDYELLTERDARDARDARVHVVRQAKTMFAETRERL